MFLFAVQILNNIQQLSILGFHRSSNLYGPPLQSITSCSQLEHDNYAASEAVSGEFQALVTTSSSIPSKQS